VVPVRKALPGGRPESLRSLLGAVILLFVALLTVAGLKGYRDLTLARANERQLATRIETTQNNIARLRGRIERLKSDPATLERTAREELGMVRPGDVLIELPQPATPLLAPPPGAHPGAPPSPMSPHPATPPSLATPSIAPVAAPPAR
jgi:cell division protein FtsB